MSELRTCAAVLVLLWPAHSAQTVAASAQTSPRLHKLGVKREGWLVPGRDYFRKLSKAAGKEIEGVAVTHKIFEAPEEIFVRADGRRVRPLVGRRSDAWLFAVRRFGAYESDGRVFAYEVGLVPVFVTRSWGKTYVGAMYNVFYVDEDGDGVFESSYSGWPLRELPGRLRRNA